MQFRWIRSQCYFHFCVFHTYIDELHHFYDDLCIKNIYSRIGVGGSFRELSRFHLSPYIIIVIIIKSHWEHGFPPPLSFFLSLHSSQSSIVSGRYSKIYLESALSWWKVLMVVRHWHVVVLGPIEESLRLCFSNSAPQKTNPSIMLLGWFLRWEERGHTVFLN